MMSSILIPEKSQDPSSFMFSAPLPVHSDINIHIWYQIHICICIWLWSKSRFFGTSRVIYDTIIYLRQLVDEFPYPCEYTAGYEFIPCSNGACHILKPFRIFKSPSILLIWYKSSYQHIITWSQRSGKGSSRRSGLPLWRHKWRSFFICHADNIKREIRVTVASQWAARVSTEHTWCSLSLVPPEHLEQPHIAKFVGPTWGSPGPMSAPWTLLSGALSARWEFLRPQYGFYVIYRARMTHKCVSKLRHHWSS